MLLPLVKILAALAKMRKFDFFNVTVRISLCTKDEPNKKRRKQ